MKIDPDIVLQLLVVEDDPTDRSWLEVMLSNASVCGYSTTHVDSIKEAVAAIERQQFHCVLLDLLLPDAQGLEALEKILATAPRLPVVVFTQIDDLSTGLAAIDMGAHEYLVKGQASGSQMLKAALFSTARGIATGPGGGAEEDRSRPDDQALGAIGAPWVCLNGDQIVVAASSSFYGLTGSTAATVLGTSFESFLSSSDAKAFTQGFDRFSTGQTAPFVRRLEMLASDGSAFAALVMATIVVGGDWNGVLVLITRVRRSE